MSLRICLCTSFFFQLDGGGTLFDDHLKIYVRGGCGGKGLPMVGGVGGEGGDVYLEAKTNLSLKKLRSKDPTVRFIAQNGKAARFSPFHTFYC